MGKISSNAKLYAKKSLAVFSAAALFLSGGVTGAVSAFTDSGITASAAETGAATITQLKLYDSNGNDITDNPIIYVDNNFASDGNVYESIKVVAKDANGDPVDDTITVGITAGADEHLLVRQSANEFMVRGGYMNGDNWVSIKAGDYSMTVASSNGEGMRRIPIKVYQPATEMTITQNGTKLDLNSGYTYLTPDQNNTVGALVIANHQYQYKATPTSGSTDTTDWTVYEGFIDGDTVNPNPTTKAEITQNGLLTPKQNGLVTIVAKYKETETSERANFVGQRMLKDEKDKTVTLKEYQNGPKYIHVTIVKENPAKDLKITNSPGALELNDTFQLTYEANPTHSGDGYDFGATDEFRWESSNTKVAKVDATGMITAVGKGDATITIYGEGENIKASCVIRVLTKATSIRFNTQTVSTRIGIDNELTAIMDPATADEEILWSSANENIATVKAINTGSFTNQQKAIITGISKGTVEITAKARNSGVEKKITCIVADKIDSSGVTLTTEENGVIKEIGEGDTVQVFDQHQITINGELKATDGSTPDDTLVWEVLNNGDNNDKYVQLISKDSNSIKLKGFARGIIQVKASSSANPSISKTFNLEVLKRATIGKILSKETGTNNYKKNLNVGSEISLVADITIDSNQPYDHDDTIVSWKSGNENVATVDNFGNVKIVGNGTTSITAITASGYSTSDTLTGFTTSQVKVTGGTVAQGDTLPSATIKFNNKNEGTVQLGATIKNQNDVAVSNCPVTWTSDDESIATVDSNGKVTGVSLGETIITAKSGAYEDKCKVLVTLPLTSATISVDNIEYSPSADSYEPVVEVLDPNGEILIRDVDYKIEYSNNTKVGDRGKVTVTGLGYYESNSNVTKEFNILQKSIKEADVIIGTIDDQELTLENKLNGVQPDIKIVHEDYTLVKDTDYTVTYSNNKATGTASVNITGKNNYKDSERKEFTIYCKHTSTTDTIVTPPTFDAAGEKKWKCNICGEEGTEVIPALVRKSTESVSVWTKEDGETKELNDGDTVTVYDQVELTINGELKAADGTASDDTIVWEILNNGENNSEYVTLVSQRDNSITLKGYARGTVQIKVSSKEIPSISKTINLQVNKKATKCEILDGETKFTSFKKSLVVGTTKTLEASFTNTSSSSPDDHDETIDRWTSSNEAAVTIDNNGKLTVVGNGQADITAYGTSGKTSNTIKITGFTTSSIVIDKKVLDPTSKDELLPTATIEFNNKFEGSKTLKATVYNQDDRTVSDCPVIWTSDDETIAKVDSEGKVTGVALGKTIITAQSGTKEDKCIVYVTYPLSDSTVKVKVDTPEYSPTATEYKPAVEVTTTNGNILEEDKDYRLEYSNNTEFGKQGQVKVIGLDNYAGKELTKTFTIAAKSLQSEDVVISPIADQELTAQNKSVGVQPALTIVHDGYTLVKDTDYTVTYSNNKVTGTASVTVTGKGKYKDSTKREFTIFCNHNSTTPKITKPATYTTLGEETYTCDVCGHVETVEVPKLNTTLITTCTVTLSQSTFTENGAAQYPIVTVKKGTETLRENTDYDIVYSNKASSAAGNYTITLTGKNAYSGSKVVTYTIKKKTIGSVTLAATRFAYTGKAITTSVTVKDNNGVPVPSTGYSVSYRSNVKKGTAKLTVTGKGNYSGSVTRSFTIVAASLSKTRLSGVKTSYTYTGKNITPTATVTYGSKKLVKNTDYTVTYTKNKAIGTAKITIKGKGNFTGTITKTFKIIPKKVTLSSVTSPKTKQMKVTWKADKTVTGYEILYSTSSAFKTGKKTVTVSKNTTKTKTITGLTKGKTYYVKVRAYKTVSGKKVYGSYSSVKKIKVK